MIILTINCYRPTSGKLLKDQAGYPLIDSIQIEVVTLLEKIVQHRENTEIVSVHQKVD